mgnify:CR=1 FL=1
MTLKRVILFSLIGLVVLGLIFALVFFFVFSNREADTEKEVEYLEFALDEMYTNIKGSNNILKIDITVEYTDAKFLEMLNKNKSKITNSVLELLRNKTLEELSGKDGQQNARKDVKNSVIEITKSNNITNVYFTQFIIQ